MLLHYSPYGLVSVYNLKADLVYWLRDILSASTTVDFYGYDKIGFDLFIFKCFKDYFISLNDIHDLISCSQDPHFA